MTGNAGQGDEIQPDGGQLDRFDFKILAVLARDGRMPVTELARHVGLSKSPCQVRLKRLQALGEGGQDYLIRAYRRSIQVRRQLLADLPQPIDRNVPSPWHH